MVGFGGRPSASPVSLDGMNACSNSACSTSLLTAFVGLTSLAGIQEGISITCDGFGNCLTRKARDSSYFNTGSILRITIFST